MKRVLVLGAGLVARPMVRYLLDRAEVVVASRTRAKAEELVRGHERGRAVALFADDAAGLRGLVAEADVVVSLLPYTHHVAVARQCLEMRKHLVTTSYVSDAMRALDGPARAAGLLFLNEIGLDPGIDHMSAMAVIDNVRAEGGRVTSFESYCGGLPAPEANDNPLGYKFSWSPRGVLMAGRNEARYLKDGREVVVPGPELFSRRWTLEVADGFTFEAYPNRNSLPYIDIYGLQGVGTMLRGTLRNPGWCETLKAIADLGLLRDEPIAGLESLTVAGWLRSRVPGTGALRKDVAAKLGLDENHPIPGRFEWLGMFEEKPVGLSQGSDLDVLAKLMLERMSYKPGERDMIVLHHRFRAEYPAGRAATIHSTLIDFGIPDGDSAMARTVSLPAAIAVRLMLEGRVSLTGVQIPVMRELYEPVLAELGRLGIVCREETLPVG
uniref:Saccharopine dehydrogenase n=1 Tax=candidate division WOR-3 bacterium TaxID=2052148 RepID=A0A7C4CEA2_UNCW3